MSAAGGLLVLVATPIGNLADLSPRAVETLAGADLVACEDTRHSGRLLAHAGIRAKRLVSLHEHNEVARIAEILALVEAGATVAVVADAGTPLVSDPGGRLVAAAVAAGLVVTSIPGPSAVLAGLVVSGFETSRWRFEGFLPRKGSERRARIAEIATSRIPCVCYESPHRLEGTLAELTVSCGSSRAVAIARELTKLHEEIWRGTLAEASARAATTPARGEHVIVVDAAPVPAGPTDDTLRDLLVRLLAAGLKRRDAAAAAQVVLGVGHNKAYAAALLIPVEAEPGA